MPEQFDPYHKWLGIPAEEQPPSHYRLLGIPLFEADQEVIASAAVQRMNWLRKFQSGSNGEAAKSLASEIASAWACLLNTERKQQYDAELRQSHRGLQNALRESLDESAPAGAAPPLPSPPPFLMPGAAPAPEAPAVAAPPIVAAQIRSMLPGAFDANLSTGVATRTTVPRRRKSSAGTTLVKIVAGGLLGLAMGYAVLSLIQPQADLLGLFKRSANPSPPPPKQPEAAAMPRPARRPQEPPPVDPLPPPENPLVEHTTTQKPDELAKPTPAAVPPVEPAPKPLQGKDPTADEQQFKIPIKELRFDRRAEAVAYYGGGEKAREAVDSALDWLARTQLRDGSWSLQGPYSKGGSQENGVAATAMAVLAFSNDGYPNPQGKSKYNVAFNGGWDALVKVQTKDGQFIFKDVPQQHVLYSHAIATWAACDRYAITQSPRHKKIAQQAINFCVLSQAAAGGWRYQPKIESDLSVTGWFVQAFAAAQRAGLDVPLESLNHLNRFLDSVQIADGSQYIYMAGKATNPAMTAVGLLSRRSISGWQRNHPQYLRGLEYLLASAPPGNENERSPYYWHYGTQVMFDAGGDFWPKWNEAIQAALVPNQEQAGPEKGSWDPEPFPWKVEGGRLFATCLATYCLQVYYHAPRQ